MRGSLTCTQRYQIKDTLLFFIAEPQYDTVSRCQRAAEPGAISSGVGLQAGG
jgi:hypothetical protein